MPRLHEEYEVIIHNLRLIREIPKEKPGIETSTSWFEDNDVTI